MTNQQVLDPGIKRFLESLKKTQHFNKETLAAYQRRSLEVLLRHAKSNSPYYRKVLDRLFDVNDQINWNNWNDIPILTRAIAQDSFSELCAQSLPSITGTVSEATSSGSTGKPLKHKTCEIHSVSAGCCSERFFTWHNLDPSAVTVRIRAVKDPRGSYPLGKVVKGWRIGHPDSIAFDLSIKTNIGDQVEFLLRTNAKYLASYPSNLREIVKYCVENTVELRLDAVMSFGEMLTPDNKQNLEKYFNRPILDRYGASEVGHISGVCNNNYNHHIASEVVLVEILDENNRAVAAGEVGKVVVTPFYNLAMPLIRYELGDYAAMSHSECGCGLSLPYFTQILGRTRNMFRFNDGSIVWPMLMSAELQKYMPNRQFQVIQKSTENIEIKYVPQDWPAKCDLEGLTDYVRSSLHSSVNLTVVAVEGISRSAGGKYEDYLCLISPE